MDTNKLLNEVRFKAIRSGGPGGQHINKVSSKVLLFFDLDKTESLTEEEKEILLNTLKNKINKNKVLILSSEETRSQHKNKEIVIKKFQALINEALKTKKERKATKPNKAALQKRLDLKKQQASKKIRRKKPPI